MRCRVNSGQSGDPYSGKQELKSKSLAVPIGGGRLPRRRIHKRKMRRDRQARSRPRSKPFCNPLHFPPTQSCQIGPCRQGFHERKTCALDWLRPDPKKPLVLFKRKMEVLKTLYKEGQSRLRWAAKTLMTVADRNLEDHRNRFIRFWLYSGMKLFLAFFVLMTAQAMSLKNFNTKPTHDQSVYVVDFIEKMTADLGVKNPQLEQDIRDWFSRKQEGKPFSAGLERLYVELAHWRSWPMTARSISRRSR